MIGRLNHVAIAVPDLAAASALYRDTLGATVSEPQAEPDHGVTVVFVELPNTKIEFLEPLGEDSPIRGFLDKLVGGVGLRRGRTNPKTIQAGDTLDFWRVLYANKEEGRLLLFAEMKVPGEAWLDFEISGDQLRQTATFRHLVIGQSGMAMPGKTRFRHFQLRR